MDEFNSDYVVALVKHHDHHERIPALFEVFADISKATFWRALSQMVPITPHFATHQELLRRMLSKERIEDIGRVEAWHREDLEWLQRAVRRPRPMKVYRGACVKFGVTGFTWTTNYQRAKRFAELSGMAEATIAVGRIDAHAVLLPFHDVSDIFTVPEYVKIERVDDVKVKDPLLLKEAQLRGVAGVHGSAKVLDITPGKALRIAIEEGRRDRDKALAQLADSRVFLEKLGFKKRLATIDEMVEEIKDAVCSAE